MSDAGEKKQKCRISVAEMNSCSQVENQKAQLCRHNITAIICIWSPIIADCACAARGSMSHLLHSPRNEMWKSFVCQQGHCACIYYTLLRRGGRPQRFLRALFPRFSVVRGHVWRLRGLSLFSFSIDQHAPNGLTGAEWKSFVSARRADRILYTETVEE